MKEIYHIIPESGEKVIIPVFEVQTPDDLYDKYRGEIYRAIVECMTRMSRGKWSTYACFAVDTQEERQIFNISLDNIQEQVGLCLSYFESIEEYETCAFIQTLNFNNI
jgi:rRNA maturation protein Nop10